MWAPDNSTFLLEEIFLEFVPCIYFVPGIPENLRIWKKKSRITRFFQSGKQGPLLKLNKARISLQTNSWERLRSIVCESMRRFFQLIKIWFTQLCINDLCPYLCFFRKPCIIRSKLLPKKLSQSCDRENMPPCTKEELFRIVVLHSVHWCCLKWAMYRKLALRFQMSCPYLVMTNN